MKSSPATRDPHVSRAEAMRMLGVKPQTLYAYVSRGWIRRVRVPGGGKHSLYSREDVEKMQARAQARAGHGPAAASAMRWGEPIIPTSITEITAEGPSYRGERAIDLARAGIGFEQVAELLWTGVRPPHPAPWRVRPLPSSLPRLAEEVRALRPRDHMIEVFALHALTLGMTRRSDADPLREARDIEQLLVGCLGFLGPHATYASHAEGVTVASGVLRALGVEDAEPAHGLIEAILVLLADHELPPSTFAARVAASTGASLHACVVSALTANSGVEIGRMYDRIEDFLRANRTAPRMMSEAQRAQAGGRLLPGFNHPLYPRGDPRARYLLDRVRRLDRVPAHVRQLLRFLDDAERQLGMLPRVEMGVVAAGEALRLPARSTGAIFTISRTAGWIAHVLEHRLSGYLMRPRARFGGRPASGS